MISMSSLCLFGTYFPKGEYIGGCNDGPGLLPLARENNGEKLNTLLNNAGVARS